MLVRPSGKALADRRQMKSKVLGAAIVAVLLVSWQYQDSWTAARPPRRRAMEPHHPPMVLQPASESFTLEFQVCNGFTNQRIALLTGLVLAAETNRSVVLPDFLLNGIQPDGIEAVTADKTDTVPFSAWFNEQEFAAALAPHGVRVVTGKAPGATFVPIKAYDSQSPPQALVTYLRKQRAQQHIKIGCPAFRLPAGLMKQHQGLLQAAAEGLLPSDRFRFFINSRRSRIEGKTGARSYNLVHLRVEKDWFALCKWWQKPEEGRDNCMNNTDTVGEQLAKHGFNRKLPVVVSTSFPDAVPEALETALESLKSSRYTPVLGSELLDGEELTREEGALVDYYLGLEADKFTGNSVSTFTAFIILERQWLGRYSTHYNGGAIPLSLFFPFYEKGH